MNGQRVLVTGGAGFVGSHLIDHCLQDDFEVSALDNLSTGEISNIESHLANRNFRFVRGDIREKYAVEDALKGVEVVFHLAAVTSVPYSIENPSLTREINTDGTRNILEMCLRGDVEKFIYVSTCAVYGEPQSLPIAETHPTMPISPYAGTKLEAEQICSEIQEKYGLKTTIFRLFNVYGLRMRNDLYGGVINKFIERLQNKMPPIIYGDGSQTRDFVNVDDVVQAFMLALDSRAADGRIFNVASGEPTSINRLAGMVTELFGGNGTKPEYHAARQGDVKHSYADIGEASHALGYMPRIPMKSGLSILSREAENEKKQRGQFA